MLQERRDSYQDVAMYGGSPGVDRVVFKLVAGEARKLAFLVAHSPDRDTPIGYAHTDLRRPVEKEDFRTVRTKLLGKFEPVDPSQIHLGSP